jgi:hypothetical protein
MEYDYTAMSVLSVIDGAELIRVMNDRFLCVWHGARHVNIYDLTAFDVEVDPIITPMFGEQTNASIYDLIEDHFVENQDD